MANNNTWRFPKDVTGKSQANRVADEIISSPPLQTGDRLIVPAYGPFFVDETLVITDYNSGKIYKHGTDFKVGGYVKSAQQESGKDCALYVVMKNQNTLGNFKLSYQAFGGNDFVSVPTLVQMMKDLANDTRPTEFSSISGKPDGYNPGSHIHDAGDVYGREYEVESINMLRQAFSMQQASNYVTAMFEYIDRFFKDHLNVAGDPHPQYLLKSAVITPDPIRKPYGILPANGAANVDPDAVLSASIYRSLYRVPQADSIWQISTDANFATVLATYNGGVSQSIHLPSRLSPTTKYYWRVAYKDTDGVQSSWSEALSFTTAAVSIARPQVTAPANNATGVPLGLTLTATQFSAIGTTDSYLNTDWEIYSDAALTIRVWSITGPASLAVPQNALAQNTKYYVRCRHRGANIGYSSWSDSVAFTTVAFPADGTFIAKVCHGTTQWDIVADGNGGQKEINPVYNSVDCGYVPPPPKDTELSRFCVGNDLHGSYADGFGGNYDKLLEANSPSCGFVQQIVLKPTINSTGLLTDPVTQTYRPNPSPFAVNVLSDTLNAVQVEIYDTLPNGTISTLLTSTTHPAGTVLTYWGNSFPANGKYMLRLRYQGLKAGWSEWSDYATITVDIPTTPIYNPRFGTIALTQSDYGIVRSSSSNFLFAYSAPSIDTVASTITDLDIEVTYLEPGLWNPITYHHQPSNGNFNNNMFFQGYGRYKFRIRVNGTLTPPAGSAVDSTSEWSAFVTVEYASPASIFNRTGINDVVTFDTLQKDVGYLDPNADTLQYGEHRYYPNREIAINSSGKLYVAFFKGAILRVNDLLLPGHAVNEVDVMITKLDGSASETWPAVTRGVWYQLDWLIGAGGGGTSCYNGSQRWTLRARNNPSDTLNIDYDTSFTEVGFTPLPDPNAGSGGSGGTGDHQTFTCFPAGVMITMADGSHKDIKDVVVGDELMSVNGKSAVVEALETPLLGNRVILEFEEGDTPLRWSQEHPIWVRENGKQWWWSANKDTWLAEVKAGATVGLKDNNTMLDGHDVEFAHTTGWLKHQIRVNHDYGNDTKLYLPKTNGAPIIANGYLVSGGTNGFAFDYSTVNWDNEIKFWKMVQTAAKKD